MFSKKGH